MRHTRRILFILAGLAVVLLAVHFAVNGVPSLSSFNPHR
jgi:hypothetical protein